MIKLKKKILIIANFTKLPWEKGNSRFPYIIDLIDKEKYDVELVTSSFSHGDKRHIPRRPPAGHPLSQLPDWGCSRRAAVRSEGTQRSVFSS